MRLVGNSRRLPIYLVADTSTSMHGLAIEAVNTGLKNFKSALHLDPHALECAAITVITFADEAEQRMPLTDAGSFVPPTLTADGNTALAKALTLLAAALDRDTRQRTTESIGDWRPLIFLMTDGRPTDTAPELEAGIDAYQAAAARWRCNLIAIACGPEVDTAVLTRLTRTVMLMPEMTPDVIASLFEWISQSVRVASRVVSQAPPGADQAPAGLPTPPHGLQIVL